MKNASHIPHGVIWMEISQGWRPSEISVKIRLSGMYLVSYIGMISHFYTRDVIYHHSAFEIYSNLIFALQYILQIELEGYTFQTVTLFRNSRCGHIHLHCFRPGMVIDGAHHWISLILMCIVLLAGWIPLFTLIYIDGDAAESEPMIGAWPGRDLGPIYIIGSRWLGISSWQVNNRLMAINGHPHGVGIMRHSLYNRGNSPSIISD